MDPTNTYPPLSIYRRPLFTFFLLPLIYLPSSWCYGAPSHTHARTAECSACCLHSYHSPPCRYGWMIDVCTHAFTLSTGLLDRGAGGGGTSELVREGSTYFGSGGLAGVRRVQYVCTSLLCFLSPVGVFISVCCVRVGLCYYYPRPSKYLCNTYSVPTRISPALPLLSSFMPAGSKVMRWPAHRLASIIQASTVNPTRAATAHDATAPRAAPSGEERNGRPLALHMQKKKGNYTHEPSHAGGPSHTRVP